MLTDKQLKRIFKFLGYEKYTSTSWEIPKEEPWHTQQHVYLTDGNKYLLSGDGFQAIIDRLTEDECIAVTLNKTVSGNYNVCIENYCFAFTMSYGTGPTNAEALLNALIKYLEAGE